VFCDWLAATALWLILFALALLGVKLNTVITPLVRCSVFRTVLRTVLYVLRCFTVLYGALRRRTILCGAVRCRTVLGPSVGPCVVCRTVFVRSRIRTQRTARPPLVCGSLLWGE
jgi:hypothetical protein